jgi:hypothetical protein
MVLIRDAVARRGGELPAAGERFVPVAGARFDGSGRLQSACSRRGQALAGIGAPLSTQIHGRVVWWGLDGQDAVIGAAARALRWS